MNIRVLVVDDEPLARVGVTTRLSAYSDMVVVGECSTGEEALTKIPQVSPDLIFVDVEMPGYFRIRSASSIAQGESQMHSFPDGA